MSTSIRDAIRKQLTDTAAVVAICSTRIYPLVLPQNPTLPACVINILLDEPQDDISGMAGLFKAEIQIDSYAETLQACQNLAEEIRLSLQGWNGTKLSVVVDGVYLETSLDGFEPEVSDYKQIQRFQVWYTRGNPD